PPLEIPEADLPLAGPQAVLHVPTAEPDTQQPAQRCRCRCVGDEILLLARLDVACPDQTVGPFATARHPHPRRLGLPHAAPLRLVVQRETPPRLLREGRAVPPQVVGPMPRLLWPRRACEAVKRLRDLADVTQVTLVATGQEVGDLAVLLVEGQPIQDDAVSLGAVDLPQGDQPLGAVDDLIGDAGSPAALAVLVPGQRQEQVGIDEGLVASAGHAEVDSDDAVLLLADLAAPLALDAGGAGALLADPGLIDDAQGAQPVVWAVEQLPSDMELQGVAGIGEGPPVVLEELLQGAYSDASEEGQRLAGLAGQVGQQAAAVDTHQVEGLGVAATEEELLQVVVQGWPRLLDLFSCHGNTSDISTRGMPRNIHTSLLRIVALQC